MLLKDMGVKRCKPENVWSHESITYIEQKFWCSDIGGGGFGFSRSSTAFEKVRPWALWAVIANAVLIGIWCRFAENVCCFLLNSCTQALKVIDVSSANIGTSAGASVWNTLCFHCFFSINIHNGGRVINTRLLPRGISCPIKILLAYYFAWCFVSNFYLPWGSKMTPFAIPMVPLTKPISVKTLRFKTIGMFCV